jgi:hypothetical protein
VVATATLLLAWLPLQRHYSSDLTWYWAIDWDRGFVRRGLCGELAELVPVRDLESAAQLMTGLSASVATATIAVVAVLRLLRGDPVSVALGLSLIVGPVGFVMVYLDPRPEYLGFPALLLVMAACRARNVGHDVAARCWLGLAAVLVALVTLASENVLFAVLPWGVVLLAATSVGAPRAERMRLVVGFAALPACAAAAVVAGGRADPAQLAALRANADRLDGRPEQLMQFVGQDLAESMRMVLRYDVGFRVWTLLLVWAVVVLLALVLLVCGARREWARLPADPLVRVSLCLPVAALLFQTATGFDWPRWTGQLGCGALVALTGWGLLVPDPDPVRWSFGRTSRVALGCLVLVLVPAVPFNIPHGEVSDFVTSRVA